MSKSINFGDIIKTSDGYYIKSSNGNNSCYYKIYGEGEDILGRSDINDKIISVISSKYLKDFIGIKSDPFDKIYSDIEYKESVNRISEVIRNKENIFNDKKEQFTRASNELDNYKMIRASLQDGSEIKYVNIRFTNNENSYKLYTFLVSIDDYDNLYEGKEIIVYSKDKYQTAIVNDIFYSINFEYHEILKYKEI